MDRLSRLAVQIGWPKSWVLRAQEEEENRRRRELQRQEEESQRRRRQCQCNVAEIAKKFIALFESILLWEDTCNSITFVLLFNVMFWGFVVFEVRDFAAACSAAFVMVLCYAAAMEVLEEDEPFESPDISPEASQRRKEQFERLIKKAKSTFEYLLQIPQEQPAAFCTAMCTLTLSLWLIGRNVDSIYIAYAIIMSVLLSPAILLQLPSNELTIEEWDSEIEEFLPAVTEDNLQVLKRAGENGDRSPTPPSPGSDASPDQFTEDDLLGLRMPSHEDGSTDGLELSELELSTGETDIDGIRFQSGHFERGSSSSDEDVDLGFEAKKLQQHKRHDDDDDDSDDSGDSDFEIIDSSELASLKNV